MNPPRTILRKWLTAAALILVSLGLAGWVLLRNLARPSEALAQVQLADGRILQIEGATFGQEHRIGSRSELFTRVRRWLPRRVSDFLEPKRPGSTIRLEHPGLVVWVNAIDAADGRNVDCQGIRVELEDAHGDLYGTQTSSWFGRNKFWRVGHVFLAYPRDQQDLKLRITPLRNLAAGAKTETSTVTFPNPHLVQAAKWSGAPLPQRRRSDNIEIVLSSLTTRTNGGGKGSSWQTPAIFFEPVWEVRSEGRLASGWEQPEWVAEDPLGNRSAQPGAHQPLLRFLATVYPQSTNASATRVIATLPRVDLATLQTNLIWNLPVPAGTFSVVALGICPPGMQVFCAGEFCTNGPTLTAVSGGGPSGWVSRSQWVTPIKRMEWHGHYTPRPTIYVRAEGLGQADRLALRMRDEAGRVWAIEPESQGQPDGVHAFIIEAAAEKARFVPELVLLRPIQAEFQVETKSAGAP